METTFLFLPFAAGVSTLASLRNSMAKHRSLEATEPKEQQAKVPNDRKKLKKTILVVQQHRQPLLVWKA